MGTVDLPHYHSWALSFFGTIILGHYHSWALSFLGIIILGHYHSWALSFLGYRNTSGQYNSRTALGIESPYHKVLPLEFKTIGVVPYPQFIHSNHLRIVFQTSALLMVFQKMAFPTPQKGSNRKKKTI